MLLCILDIFDYLYKVRTNAEKLNEEEKNTSIFKKKKSTSISFLQNLNSTPKYL